MSENMQNNQPHDPAQMPSEPQQFGAEQAAAPNIEAVAPGTEERSGLTPKGLMYWISGGGAMLILAIIGVFALVMPPAVPPLATNLGVTDNKQQVATMESVADLYTELNTALQTQDRELFFSYVSGDAVAPLTRWWDNMDKFGWTMGGISTVEITDEWIVPAEEGPAEVQTIFGAAMGFSAFSPRGSGNRDAGLHFIQGMQYTATISDDEGPKITAWQSGEAKAAWDLADLYVAKGEHSIVAGLPEEQELIDSIVPVADQAAVWVLDDFAAAGREVPLGGFNVFVSEDQANFGQWFLWPQTQEWLFDVAGYAIPMQRPTSSAAGVDPLLATGDSTSTSVVSIGPSAMSDLERILVHEFVHVVHFTESSSSFVSPPRATFEGWARYQDKRFANGGSFPGSDSAISYCVANFLSAEAAVPTDAQLTGPDASCYYELASTLYRYAEVSGYDQYQLAKVANSAGENPLNASSIVAPEGVAPLSAEGWVNWLRENY